MKIITCNRDIPMEFTTDSNLTVQTNLYQKGKYVMSEMLVQNCLEHYGQQSIEIIADLMDLPNRYNGQDLTNKKLLCIREGGAGDLLFQTPVYRYLKNKYPTCEIALSCSPIYHSLFTSNEHISKLFPHIVPYDYFKGYDYFVNFEGLIEGSKEAEVQNAYDIIFKRFGFPPSLITNKTPVVRVHSLTIEYWMSVLGEQLTRPKKIGVQLRASSPIRTPDFDKMGKIIKDLSNKGYTVFLIDSMHRRNFVEDFIHSHMDGGNENIVNASVYSDSFERMAGIIFLMDMFVGPDSSGTHIAAGCNKPIVGLYGPFRSHLRLRYYKNAVGIDVVPKRCIQGCFAHTYDICLFAKELGDKFAPCWKLLDTNRVIEEVEKLYNRVYDNTGKV